MGDIPNSASEGEAPLSCPFPTCAVRWNTQQWSHQCCLHGSDTVIYCWATPGNPSPPAAGKQFQSLNNSKGQEKLPANAPVPLPAYLLEHLCTEQCGRMSHWHRGDSSWQRPSSSSSWLSLQVNTTQPARQGRDAGGHPSGASLGLGAQVSEGTPDSSSRDSCLKSPKPALAKGKVRTDLTDLVDLLDRPPQSCSWMPRAYRYPRFFPKI